MFLTFRQEGLVSKETVMQHQSRSGNLYLVLFLASFQMNSLY